MKHLAQPLLGVFFLVVIVLPSNPAGATEYRCADNKLVSVTSPDEELLREICSAADKAISFLSRYNLHLKRVVRMIIVERAINSHGYVAYGSFDRQRDHIELMSYSAVMGATKSPQMYDQPFDREHYHGAIAHEVTHAVFFQNGANIEDQLTNVAQEYLAHAVQLGTLSEERRHAIIAANEVGPWESGDSISDVYMGLNPTGFAVKSYLHLMQMEDPLPFIKILLNNNWFYISVP